MNRWARAGLVLSGTGAILGTLLDGIHTHTGTTWYPHPLFWSADWWTPVIFAGAAVAIGLGRVLIEERLDRPTPPASPRSLLASFLFFSFAYGVSGFYPGGGPIKTLTLGALFAIAWVTWDRTRLGLWCALGTAAGGVATEIALVHAGAFFHRDAELFGVPTWLPWLYCSASVAIGRLGLRLAAPAATS